MRRSAITAALAMAAVSAGSIGEAAPSGPRDIPTGGEPPRSWRKLKKPYVRKVPTTPGDFDRLAKAEAKRARKSARMRACSWPL